MKKPVPWWSYALWFLTGALVGWVMLETAGYGILRTAEWYIVIIPLSFLVTLAVWPVSGNRSWFAAIGGLAVLPLGYALQTTNSPDGRVCQNFGSSECVQLYAPWSFVILTVLLLLISASLIFFLRGKGKPEPKARPKSAKAPKPAPAAKSAPAVQPAKAQIGAPAAVKPPYSQPDFSRPAPAFEADSIFRDPGPAVVPPAPVEPVKAEQPVVKPPIITEPVVETRPTQPVQPPEPAADAPDPATAGAAQSSPRPTGVGQRPSGVGQRPMAAGRGVGGGIRPVPKPVTTDAALDTATGDIPLAIPKPAPEPVAEPLPGEAPAELVPEAPAEPRVFRATAPRASWPDLTSIRTRPVGRKPVAATTATPGETSPEAPASAEPSAAGLGWDLVAADGPTPDAPTTEAPAAEPVADPVPTSLPEANVPTDPEARPASAAGAPRPTPRPTRPVPGSTAGYDSSAMDLVASIFDTPDPKPATVRRRTTPASAAVKRPDPAGDEAANALESELSKLRELLPDSGAARTPAQPAPSSGAVDRLAEIEENLARMRDMIGKSE
jgi:hypothetical protein